MHTKPILTAAILILLASAAGCMKTDPDSIRRYVQEEIQQQFPQARFGESGENEIAVLHANGSRQVIDVSLIQEGCKRVPRSCGHLVGRVLLVMQEGLDASAAEISLEQVQPILSSPATPRGIVQQNSPSPPVVQPIADNLAVQFAVINGDAVTMLDESRLAKLGVAPEVLVKEAFKNVETTATVNITPFPGEASVYQVYGILASVGVLSKTHARKVKAQLGCQEVALAFPRRGTTLAACAEDAAKLARLREIAARFTQPESAVISRDVYLLTGSGVAIIKA